MKPDLPLNHNKINSILILRPDKLGDMIATIPAIHELKSKLPHVRIEVVASPRNNIIVANDENWDYQLNWVSSYLQQGNRPGRLA